MKRTPIASLSLDLDNQWSYMKIHGDKGWETFPSYLDLVVPRALDVLKNQDLKITFFIVGQDAALDKNQRALAMIPAAGHEVGNHSFHHESWLHLYPEDQIEAEIIQAETIIHQVTGVRPTGFRGPGYSFSPAVLRVLERRGYLFDASTFPSYLGPLARAYYFMTAKLTPEEKEKRKSLFGGFRDGFQPLKPYRWRTEHSRLLEIPVTTMPVFKIPIHFSYLIYLSVFCEPLALVYFRLALLLCKLTKTQPSMLLHPLDFLGKEDVPELAFFPGMSLGSNRKLIILNKFLSMLKCEFSVVPMGQHAELITGAGALPLLEPPDRAPVANPAF